jgi:ketosteroid isomerase-like protein
MTRHGKTVVLVVSIFLLAGTAGAGAAEAPAAAIPADERAIWDLERAYWRYVQDNDLASYSRLWHEAFVGWPSVSATPVSKEHITDWITSQTSTGAKFQTLDFKPAAIRVTGDVAMAYYWVEFRWVGQDGKGDTHRLRITHAWHKDATGWQILGGMSMPEGGAGAH